MRVVGILMVQYGANVLFVNLFSGLQTRSLWCSLHLDARVDCRTRQSCTLYSAWCVDSWGKTRRSHHAETWNVCFAESTLKLLTTGLQSIRMHMFVTNVDESHADNLNIMCTHHIARNIPTLNLDDRDQHFLPLHFIATLKTLMK